jgi:hypothetical protein
MAGDPKNPEVGELSVDATVCGAYAVDLEPGATVGMVAACEGVDDVIGEIKANQAAHGEVAGVTALDFDTVVGAHARVKEIDNLLPAARKMVEILEETRAQQVDIRERTIRSIAQSVDARARKRGNAVLLAKYEATRAYRSQTALKGVKTRKKNAEEKKAAAAPPPAKPENG